MATVRRRRSRGQSRKGRYVLIALIVIIAAAIGWYAFSSSQTTTSSSGLQNVSTSSQATSSSAANGSVSSVTGLVYAKIGTSMGTIEVELYPNSAPKTVTNFVTLAKSGFFDNLVWHRIVKGFVIQTGDPNSRNGGGDKSLWGTGGSPSTVPLEIDRSLHNDVGYLGMARSQDPNSGSSQFYINLTNNAALDGQYTVFGKVISGMDVALNIGNVPVNSASQPISNVFVTSITIQSTP